jgi:competence protein ComEC
MNRIKFLPVLLTLFLLASCSPVDNPFQTTGTGTVSAPTIAASTVVPTLSPSLTCSDTPVINIPVPSETPTPTAISLLKVYFVDVGQGDSELILAPDGGIVLIDGGEPDSGLLSFLKDHGITHIDLMIATHPHSDHIGGLTQVLNSMPVTRVVTNGQISTSSTFAHFLDAVAADKAAFIIVKQGDTISQGILDLAVLNPVDTHVSDLNSNSLVLRLVYGRVSFLFMGDADKTAEANMIAAGLAAPVTILKVGHHGSDTASSPAFLALIKPAVAIYSAGVGNTFGHPKAITLTDLAAVGAQIYGTDLNGTVLVSTDSQTYQVIPAKGGPRLPPLPTITP